MRIIFALVIVLIGSGALICCAKIMLEDCLFDRADIPWFRRKRAPSPESTATTTQARPSPKSASAPLAGGLQNEEEVKRVAGNTANQIRTFLAEVRGGYATEFNSLEEIILSALKQVQPKRESPN